MATIAKTNDPVMMRGSGGERNYLVIARRGGIALGIKPETIAAGDGMGGPGTVWFGLPPRPAPAAGLFPAEPEGNVVKLEKTPENLWDAWPNVEWEKRSPARASTTIGVLLRGRLDDAEAQPLLAQMEDGTIARKLADYLYELVGEQHMILSRDEIADHLTKTVYGSVAKSIRERMEVRKAVLDEMEQSIGTFGTQAQLLKKAYEKVKGSSQGKAEETDAETDAETEDDDPPTAS